MFRRSHRPLRRLPLTVLALLLGLFVPLAASADADPTAATDAPGAFDPARHLLDEDARPAVDAPASPAMRPRPEAGWQHLVRSLTWRHIGPWRGGRVTAVTGVASQPGAYWMGATGGGLWRTDDGGITWQNASDGFMMTGTVGAITVAPSDPNVIWVGMGEGPPRGVMTSHGDGVYRSTDGGATWRHVGLAGARHIPDIRVHPDDPDVAWAAVQGRLWGPSEDRGVYKTVDGGTSWTQVLFVDADTGAADLAIDPTNPRVLYAAMWHHRRYPWRIESGGPGSGLYKTVDGGTSWTRLEDGLPRGVIGKMGVAVSASRPSRVWAMVEADDGGLYRSDNGGASWMQVNSDRLLRARAWYYTHVIADPHDADTVYVLNAPMLRSIDGGRTFTRVPTPHTDNHALWIHPTEPNWMINGNDGGANVSWNGGRTWSTQYNQPTAQLYRVAVDRRTPYRLYAAQQDNSTLEIVSRAADGAIDRADWQPIGGCETAHVAFDPDDPRYVYAGCYQGLISVWDRATGNARNIMAEPMLGLGIVPRELPYRFNWSAPIVADPFEPSVIYHAANVVLRTDDRGVNWTAISEDLTRNEDDKHGDGGGPITNELVSGENYNTLLALAASPHRPGELWAGADDGLVHVRRVDDPTSADVAAWQDVTPPALRETPGQINTIAISPHDPDVVYLSVMRHRFDDLRPHAWRTDDGGASWRSIVDGLADDAMVRVIREDPARPGLLYAGTEAGAYVSFDGGDRWHGLQRNLPRVPITDLQIAHIGDLVVSTMGRGLWILDDLGPLRALDDARAADDLFVPAPRAVTRTVDVSAARPGTALSFNPPGGVWLHYGLSEALAAPDGPPAAPAADADAEAAEAATDAEAAEAATDADGDAPAADAEDADADGGDAEDDAVEPPPPALVLEIFDASDRRVRRVTSDPPGPDDVETDMLTRHRGLNRYVWDLRETPLTDLSGLVMFGSTQGARVLPGHYRLRLTAQPADGDDGEPIVREVTVEVRADARAGLDARSYDDHRALFDRLDVALDDLHRGVTRAAEVRAQIQGAMARAASLTPPDASPSKGVEAIEEAGKALIETLEEWEETLVQRGHESFQDIIRLPPGLNAQIGFLRAQLDGAEPPLPQSMVTRGDAVIARWDEAAAALQTLIDEDLAAFNALFIEHAVPAVVVPHDDAPR